MNGVVEIVTDLPEIAVLDALHRIEEEAGRVRRHRWGARVCDLDLLTSGPNVLPDEETVKGWMNLPLDEQRTRVPEELLLPHPRLQDRGFVLVPMGDIDPQWLHPILKKTVAQMIAELPDGDIAAMTEILSADQVMQQVFPEGLPKPD